MEQYLLGVASFPKLSGPEMPSLMSTAEVPDDCVSKLNVSCDKDLGTKIPQSQPPLERGS